MKRISTEHRLKISKALKGKFKPPRSQEHRNNLSKAMSKNYKFTEVKNKVMEILNTKC